MPKLKRTRLSTANHHKNASQRGDATHLRKGRKMHTFSKLSTTATRTTTTTTPAKSKKKIQPNQRPTIPFGRNDRILLIGEGKFSIIFIYSLKRSIH